MSDGDSHNLNNLPILQAGNCGGYFKTGQAIDVENTSGKDTGGTPNAALSQGNSDGDCVNGSTLANLDSAGTTSTVATQPINKYFCNLMNAVGVKADSTGFPVKGGTMPVTHFGK
jgi:flagellar hook-associated protein FlgK